MVDVPAAVPVTSPVEETEAIAKSDEVQGLTNAAVPEPASWVVPFRHAASVPVITGSALTVTVAVD